MLLFFIVNLIFYRFNEQAAYRSLNKVLNGDFGEGVHLFPFRTEQLSPSAPMVLGV
jgi:hypothetical protein